MSYTPPPPPPPGAGGYAAPQTNQKALWSMILGILGIVCCGIFAGIPALILGNSAKKEIAASGGAQTGDGMAKAGVILGWISIALSILGIIFVIATGALSNAGNM
jgi:putative exporter of polyketide antibiotics